MMRISTFFFGFIAVIFSHWVGGNWSMCRADYCYAGTHLSWEWLTDASRAIVVGPVTSVGDSGFELKVERVLKCRQLTLEPGQVVSAPVLGRTQLFAQHEKISLESGWPALSDWATYPADREIRDRPWRPKFYRAATWSQGDRCLIFFGQDLQSPLQIINLDRPLKCEVEFLTVDMLGQVVTKADDLISRIVSRVATTSERGEPRIRSAGFSSYLPNSPIDGQDYYHILSPPERRVLEAGAPEPLALPAKLETLTLSSPYDYPKVDDVLLRQAVVYWYLSNRSAKEFSEDARQERNMAVGWMLGNFAHWPADEDSPFSTTAKKVGVSEFCRNQIYRCHSLNYRTYPLGWWCVMSYDKKHMAFLDGHTLMVYAIDANTQQAARLVFSYRGVHRARSYIEFCQDGRMMAFTTEENSVSLADLRDGKIVWTSKAEFPKSDGPAVTVCMEFSHDHRFLVQESKKWDSDHPSDWGRQHRAQTIHVWDVATGEVSLVPYKEWRDQLRYVSFHPQDSSRIRLHDMVTPEVDTIWDIRTRTHFGNVAQNAPWPRHQNPTR